MAGLGPFEPSPRLAVAASGGADSTALVFLAQRWASLRQGTVYALVVDHGLRRESGREARQALATLGALGIEGAILPVSGLAPGSGLAARARTARYDALLAACARLGIVHLLLGHHAADQAETLVIREMAGSGPTGLAGMAALRETGEVRLLRPLLAVPPGDLRALLRLQGLPWIEDPSNRQTTALRPRIREHRADPDGTGPATQAALAAAAAAGLARARQDERVADELAARARLLPEGYAVLTAGPLAPASLAALLRTLGGSHHAPATVALRALAASPHPATLGGVQLLPAGRHGPPGALLLVREARAMAAPVAARRGAVWDDRFVLTVAAPPGATLGSLGLESRRGITHLPAAVLRTLPALRHAAQVISVPHLDDPAALRFRPPEPLADAAFRAAR